MANRTLALPSRTLATTEAQGSTPARLRLRARFMLLGLSLALTPLGASAEQRFTLQPLGNSYGEQDPVVIWRGTAALPGGTFIAQDKSKGITWLLDLKRHLYRVVELPYNSGNHETAVSPDGATLASTHYDRTRPGDGEGGGDPGNQLEFVDIASGRAWVPAIPPLTQAQSAPHGVNWMANGDLLVTGQLHNGLYLVRQPLKPGGGPVTFYGLGPTGCSTPHLVHPIANSSLVVTGCRSTNPGDPAQRPGHLGVVDLATGRTRSLPASLGAEGIGVTASGDVWLGGQRGDQVSIYSFGDRPRTIDNLRLVKTLDVPRPIRIVYEPNSGTVTVASLLPANASTSINMRSYDASSRTLRNQATISGERGRINSQGMEAGQGFLITAGFDNQTLVLIDPTSLKVAAEVQLPRCSLPRSSSQPTAMSVETAKAIQGLSGTNNWSGGVCPGTMRNPDDRRFSVLDGFHWSPQLLQTAGSSGQS